ncbi:MAG: hypothetical protein RJB66_1880 [Pseudomonadota bacterium]|jgi:hypothetical protein
MSALGKLFLGFVRYIFVSLAVTIFGMLVSVSLLTGKFPPSWQQIKGLKKNFEAITAISKQGLGSGGLSNLQTQLQNLPKGMVGAPQAKGGGHASGDPEMADFEEVKQHYQRQAALSKALTGQMEASSQLPQAPEATQGVAVDPALQERLRKLEDLVSSLHAQVYRMSLQINQLQKNPTSGAHR